MYDRLTAEEIRNIEEGAYLVAELHEDEYWEQGEGRVTNVTEHESGKVVVTMKGTAGYFGELTVPRDARKGLRFGGVARGADNLRVDRVTKRKT